jgi:integrase
MPTAITETSVARALKDAKDLKRRRDLSDKGCPGLRLRVTPAGSRTWVLACRDRGGRMRRFMLGSWEQIGLADARTKARALHMTVKADGADPTAEKRAERARAAEAREGIGTLAALLDLYGRTKGSKLRSWPDSRKRIDVVLHPLLTRPVADLKLGEVQLAVDTYSSPKSAAFVVRSVRPVLKWASAPGRAYLAAKLVGLVPPAEGAVERRKRILTREELRAVLPVLRAPDNPYAAALRFMLLTMCRRQEAAAAVWRNVDLDARTWTIPATKNGEPHVVPLSRQAVALLRSRLPDGPDGEPTKPAPGALIFATSTGAMLGNWDRETKRIIIASGLATEHDKTGDVTMLDGSAIWTRHDLRRTGATMLGEMGELPDIIEAALNHTSIRSPLAATYNRSRYRPQVAAGLQRLADALDGIQTGAGAVVPLRAAER